MGIPYNEIQVPVFAGLLTNKGIDTPAPVRHTSASAAPSQSRISTTSAALMVSGWLTAGSYARAPIRGDVPRRSVIGVLDVSLPDV
jgi:hypothetical protein